MTSVQDTLYVIPATDPEKKRLITQYAMKKRIFGWKTAIPPAVDSSTLSNVLDVAAGTCIWTFDFAAIPEVKARLVAQHSDRNSSSPSIRLYACDIETKFFPDQTLLDGLGITTFQQDVTKPFPADLHGKFDLIQISFLLLCLTEGGWKDALENCRQALKPGGLLMLHDADPIMYSATFPPPPEDAVGHDLSACLNAPGWLGKANRIYTAFSLANGFVPDLSFRLPNMVVSAGYEIVDTMRGTAPCGKLCHSLQGGELSDYEDFTVENLEFIFEHLATALLKSGKLEASLGVKVATREEMMAMVRDVTEGFRSEGALSLGRYCLARKLSDN